MQLKFSRPLNKLSDLYAQLLGTSLAGAFTLTQYSNRINAAQLRLARHSANGTKCTDLWPLLPSTRKLVDFRASLKALRKMLSVDVSNLILFQKLYKLWSESLLNIFL